EQASDNAKQRYKQTTSSAGSANGSANRSANRSANGTAQSQTQTQSQSQSNKTISSNPDRFDQPLAEVFSYYLGEVGRNPKTYELTKLRKKKGAARLRECLNKTHDDLANAVALMKLAVDALAASDFHMG